MEKKLLQKIKGLLIALVLGVNISNAQTITTICGTGFLTYSGDNGAATLAGISTNEGQITTDVQGNIFFTDKYNHRIRRIDAISGIITTVAGNGNVGFSGDNGAATSAQLSFPSGIAVDASGNLYICDSGNNRIRKVNSTGTITTIAGNGTSSSTGDGGLAINGTLNNPGHICIDPNGNIYFAEYTGNRVRKINSSSIISTYAGTGVGSNTGNGGLATSATLFNPWPIACDALGNVYVASYNAASGGAQVRKISTSGTITAFAGTGTSGYGGDGGPAISASLSAIGGLGVNNIGEVLISDRNNNRVRKVSSSGIISTYAGNGTVGFSGDNGLSTLAQIGTSTWGIANYNCITYFIDNDNARLRKVVGGVNPTITVSSGSVCSGNSYSLNPTGASTYSFQGGNAVVNPTTNSTYTVVGYSNLGCASSMATSSVTVLSNPTVVAASSSTSICSGQMATLTANGASSYTWNPGGIGSSISVTPLATQVYTLSGTGPNGCANSTTFTQQVNQNPTVTATSSETNILCIGQSATLTAVGANSYSWNPGGVGNSTIISPTVTTTYSVTGTNTTGCSNMISITQSVSACTGINQLANTEMQITKIYPNPCNEGTVTIETQSGSVIKIFNSIGQFISESNITGSVTRLDISNLPNGIYLVLIESNEGEILFDQKLIVH